ncbi:MAG TPA: bacillithiol biosynthesis deacetylase BshB1 [Symbiobacteriaceae bacterium]|nr:bacillithiol biosynthesis deacetylase BshB1 [Symbiobacteriaceae bacterium]
MAIDLLAFGPHPDDVELGMGGTLARQAAAGYQTAIIDLTRGEMGSNGTPAQRVAEGEAAATILGCAWRRNLALPDRGLDPRDPEQLRKVVDAIRMVRPQVAAINWGVDRHPDHGAASRLLEEALFTSGLRRYETEFEAYRPAKVVYYFINDEAEPSFFVDITEYQAKKSESVFAHRSQFLIPAGGVETRLNRAGGLPYLVESRDRLFGAKVGVQYAEGFIARQPRLVADLISG